MYVSMFVCVYMYVCVVQVSRTSPWLYQTLTAMPITQNSVLLFPIFWYANAIIWAYKPEGCEFYVRQSKGKSWNIMNAQNVAISVDTICFAAVSNIWYHRKRYLILSCIPCKHCPCILKDLPIYIFMNKDEPINS